MEEVMEFLRTNAFAILISRVGDRPWGTHLPLELIRKDGSTYFEGHMARANPQWRDLPEGGEVLCIFNGPHAYISSSWYQEEEVPTWDYIAVHVYGTIHYQEEPEVMKHLERLMEKYESDSENPVQLQKLSSSTRSQVKGVIGFQIRVNEVQAAYKLSQGRPEDHERITRELRKRGRDQDIEVAQAICPFKGSAGET